MITFDDLKNFLATRDYKIIIAADAEPIVHSKAKNQVITKISAGGAAVALEPIAKASQALFICRGRTEEDRAVLDPNSKIGINVPNGSYEIKRLFFTHEQLYDYYLGFSNQTMWPLCHVAFESPVFSSKWFNGYSQVNEMYANAIKEEITGKTLIWLNDYQLSLVPTYLGKMKDAVISMFWHIPWPTWETFRILPQKKEILKSLLNCDFIAFHRGYHVRNFLRCVERELEARIDLETNKVHFSNHITTVKNLPLGVDVDVIKGLLEPQEQEDLLPETTSPAKNMQTGKEAFIDFLFKEQKVIIGVDRLDYTKGLILRLEALDLFFSEYPQYIGKVNYVGILAPSREQIPAYMMLEKKILSVAKTINEKYAKDNWQPINVIAGTFTRREIMELYKKSAICLVTPRDDGMNLVSKEFVIAASQASDPGMLVLSQFAGSAIDLTQALIVNPYDLHEVANAIKKGLEMSKKEKMERNKFMTTILEDRNIYQWGEQFIREAEMAGRENRKVTL